MEKKKNKKKEKKIRERIQELKGEAIMDFIEKVTGYANKLGDKTPRENDFLKIKKAADETLELLQKLNYILDGFTSQTEAISEIQKIKPRYRRR